MAATTELISTVEAARILGVTPARVRVIGSDGTDRLNPVMIGGSLVWSRSEVEALSRQERRPGKKVNGKKS